MIKRILLPLEHGDDATSAVALARRMAQRRKVELLLLRVEEWPISGSFGFGWAPSWRAGRLQALKSDLEGPEGVPATILSPEALPASSILKQARLRAASLIVVPYRHERALLRVLGGHPADRILRDSPLPVIAVPATESPRLSGLSRVLYTYENGPQAVPGLHRAIEFAQMFDATLFLQRLRSAAPPSAASPFEPRDDAAQGGQDAKSLEGRLLWILKRREVPTQLLPAAGEPLRDVVGAVVQNAIDLALVARTHDSERARLSLARHILEEAQIPVLLTPEESPLSPVTGSGSRVRVGI
ncbi:MAG TPA: universal stress protein [Planctomycetota bacterium]|jgi:nucleotide-binding universal stress UspA family protein|nr:universal stress protein [Planctomycetota bacterium]